MPINRIKPFKDNLKNGLVYLISTPIGNIDDISKRAIDILNSLDIVLAEDTRNSSILFKRIGVNPKKLISCFSYKEEELANKILDEVKLNNLTIGLVSDAGTPGISDPGAILVKKAIELNIPVSAILGPSAFIQGLILSGFNTANFSFYGFLPTKEQERERVLSNLVNKEETLIFYEAPHRLIKTIQSMQKVFKDRKCLICRELSKIYEEYIRGSLDELVNLDPSSLIGEFVIVIEGNNATSNQYDDEKIIQMAKLILDEGISKSTCCKIIVNLTNLKKNYIYDLINKL